MSRRIKVLVFALVAVVALGATACQNPAAPSLEQCDIQNSGCFQADHQAGTQGSGT